MVRRVGVLPANFVHRYPPQRAPVPDDTASNANKQTFDSLLHTMLQYPFLFTVLGGVCEIVMGKWPKPVNERTKILFERTVKSSESFGSMCHQQGVAHLQGKWRELISSWSSFTLLLKRCNLIFKHQSWRHNRRWYALATKCMPKRSRIILWKLSQCYQMMENLAWYRDPEREHMLDEFSSVCLRKIKRTHKQTFANASF